MTSRIGDRLNTYGRPECLICGQLKERDYRDTVKAESVFAGERYQLVCRNHPGHPLYGQNEAGPAHMEDSHTAPVRQSAEV